MKRANAKEAAKALNSFIGSMKDSTLEQITKKMREFNIPYGKFLIRDFIKRNYLIAVGGGKYSWQNERPVYFEEIQQVFEGKRSEQQRNAENRVLNEGSAIKLLKQLGYKVLRPVTQYEEI